MTELEQVPWNEERITLLETVDRLLNRGVMVAGDVTLSVANVDLVYLGVRLLLASVEAARQWGASVAEE